MGLKRPASVLEDHIYYAEPCLRGIGIGSCWTSSSVSSTTPSYSPPGIWAPARRVPDQVSRTRKRHRDDRPDEDTVHEQTLRKLYDAQRLHLDQTLPMPDADALRGDGGGEEFDMDDVLDSPIPRDRAGNQPTIHTFFKSKDLTTSVEPVSPSCGGSVHPFFAPRDATPSSLLGQTSCDASPASDTDVRTTCHLIDHGGVVTNLDRATFERWTQ